MSQFGINLKKYLKKRGMTDAMLAERLNITQQAVNNWINTGSQPRSKRLAEIAQILGVTTNDLLEYNEAVVYDSEYVTVRRDLMEAKDREIEYLRKIVQLSEEKERVKNIAVVSPKQ